MAEKIKKDTKFHEDENYKLLYELPEKVAMPGVPRAINWNLGSGEANNFYWLENAWNDAGAVAWPFKDYKFDSFSQKWDLSASTDCDEWTGMMRDALWVHQNGNESSLAWRCESQTIQQDLVSYKPDGDPWRAAFVGKLSEPSPVIAETPPVSGSYQLSITTGFQRKESWSVTTGWSAGASTEISAGEKGVGGATVGANFSYSRSETEGKEIIDSYSNTLNIPLEGNEISWLVARKAGGNYKGWLLFHYGKYSGRKIWGFEAFPVRSVYVKAPDVLYPVSWHRRWVKKNDLPSNVLTLTDDINRASEDEVDDIGKEIREAAEEHMSESPPLGPIISEVTS